MTSSIRVESEQSGTSVRSRVRVSRDLRKFFRSYTFFTHYDTEIHAGEGILNIPVVSFLLPLAWITGADVYVNVLDREFAEAMATLQEEYKKIYPKVTFTTTLHADKLVDNESASSGSSLLFTGGVDSTSTLFDNLQDRPRLITILGTDIPYSHVQCREKAKAYVADLARRVGAKVNFIRTSGFDMLNLRRIDHYYWGFQPRYKKSYWVHLGYSLGHLGQTAPLSVGRFNRIMVAGALSKRGWFEATKYPDASSPATDEKIAWAHVRVHFLGELDRPTKIQRMKKQLVRHGVKLRVCSARTDHLLRLGVLNCSQCEKCLRTMACLAIAGIDPDRAGFDVSPATPGLMKDLFLKKRLPLSQIELCWLPIQNDARNLGELGFCGLKSFFDWFCTAGLVSFARPERAPFSAHALYFRVPFPVAHLIRKLLYDPLKISTSRMLRYRLNGLIHFSPFGRRPSKTGTKTRS